ncbi:unnamed protein product [Pieris macdunnoughi]|uniref:Uncharacterized protein n=1 Tax=Pieris macdunnoughi TaxID=345717 RepID=A0A821UJJ1_9NEOP|nr:unnamed protein product [Pieris macdunnoughi]
MPPTLSKRAKIAIVVAATVMPPQISRKKRKEWAKTYLKNRDEFSHMKLIKSLDCEDFRIYLRLDHETFEELLNLVKPLITKTDTVMRKAVTAEERLIATKKSRPYMTRNCVDFEDVEQHTFRPGDWRQNDISIGLRSERERTEVGRQVRQIFTDHFNGEGRVDFQERMINVLNI